MAEGPEQEKAKVEKKELRIIRLAEEESGKDAPRDGPDPEEVAEGHQKATEARSSKTNEYHPGPEPIPGGSTTL